MRTVNFGIAQDGVRDPLCDERDVMKKFNTHIKHCDTCYENLGTWSSGQPLCSRGHGYVLDMKPYFFCKGGKPYSMIDREKKDQRTRVRIPSEFKYVNTLFAALDDGYNTNSSRSSHRSKPIIHQQPVQEPAPRREHRRSTSPQVVIVPTSDHYVLSHTPRSPRTHQREERYHREPRRGSLYYEDQHRMYRPQPEMLVATPTRYYR